MRQMFKQLAIVQLAAALLGTGAGQACAQSNASSIGSADSTDQNNAGAPEAGKQVGLGNVGADGDKGTITKATKDKPGVVGEDGSPPKPKVNDDPQHRCLSPAGIC
jgi:hypothetical protein